MSQTTIKWCVSWSANKLHAVDINQPTKGMLQGRDALCGNEAYIDPPNDYADARFKSGELEKCKRCLKKVEKLDAK